MVIACWSAKGGAGTTVVAATLALLASRRDPSGAILCDLAGDAPACFGVPEPDGAGVNDLLAGIDEMAPDTIGRLLVPVAPGTGLLPSGREHTLPEGAGRLLLGLLDATARTVLVDAGTRPDGAAAEAVRGADRSILVTRPCYLALRRALEADHRPSDVILVNEPGRALRRGDVEDVLGVPVRAEVQLDPVVARVVDAGVLATRLPRRLERALSRAA